MFAKYEEMLFIRQVKLYSSRMLCPRPVTLHRGFALQPATGLTRGPPHKPSLLQIRDPPLPPLPLLWRPRGLPGMRFKNICKIGFSLGRQKEIGLLFSFWELRPSHWELRPSACFPGVSHPN